MPLLYEEETYRLRRIIFQVRNELGPGWLEQIYYQALYRALKDENVPALSKPRRMLRHHQTDIHLFEPDLIVWDKIILELKVLSNGRGFTGEHFAQIIHYLKFFQKRLGLLIDFAPDKVRIKRVIWQPRPFIVNDNSFDLPGYLSTTVKSAIQTIRQTAESIGQQFGLGYSDVIYRELMKVELSRRGLHFRNNIEAPAIWKDTVIAYQRTPFFILDEQILLHTIALSNSPSSYELARLRRALQNLALPIGVLVNFSYRQLQLFTIL